MRALFSLVGLLVVVAIIMLMAKKQLQAVAPAIVPPASATAGGTAPHRAGAVPCGAAKGAAGCQSRAGARRCPRVGCAAVIAAPMPAQLVRSWSR